MFHSSLICKLPVLLVTKPKKVIIKKKVHHIHQGTLAFMSFCFIQLIFLHCIIVAFSASSRTLYIQFSCRCIIILFIVFIYSVAEQPSISRDLRYYNHLMSNVPEESSDIGLILHCLVEQVNKTILIYMSCI